jgi:hypothetical protein
MERPHLGKFGLVTLFAGFAACRAGRHAEFRSSALSGSGSSTVLAESRSPTATGLRIERKILNADGSFSGQVVDQNGNPLTDAPIAQSASPFVTDALKVQLASAVDSDPIVVDFGLTTSETAAIEPEFGSAGFTTARVDAVTVNGRVLDGAEFSAYLTGTAKRPALTDMQLIGFRVVMHRQI